MHFSTKHEPQRVVGSLDNTIGGKTRRKSKKTSHFLRYHIDNYSDD